MIKLLFALLLASCTTVYKPAKREFVPSTEEDPRHLYRLEINICSATQFTPCKTVTYTEYARNSEEFLVPTGVEGITCGKGATSFDVTLYGVCHYKNLIMEQYEVLSHVNTYAVTIPFHTKGSLAKSVIFTLTRLD